MLALQLHVRLLPLRRERKKMMMTRERKRIVTNPLLQHLIHWLIQKRKKEDGDTYSEDARKGSTNTIELRTSL